MPSETSQRRHPAQAGESRQMEKPEARKFASRWVGLKIARAMQMPSSFLRHSFGLGFAMLRAQAQIPAGSSRHATTSSVYGRVENGSSVHWYSCFQLFFRPAHGSAQKPACKNVRAQILNFSPLTVNSPHG